MLNTTGKSYKQNAIANESSVKLNAYASNYNTANGCVPLCWAACGAAFELRKYENSLVFVGRIGDWKNDIDTNGRLCRNTFLHGVHFAPASAIAQSVHTTLAWPLLNFEKYISLVFKKALKIRVSLVRFQSRPPIRTVVLLCRTAVFLFLGASFLDAYPNAQDIVHTLKDFA